MDLDALFLWTAAMHIDDVSQLKSALSWSTELDRFLSKLTKRIETAVDRDFETILLETEEANDVFPALVAAWEFAKEHAHEIS